jgi:hypothetical protein
MKIAAIVATATIAGSIAYAAGSQGVVGKQSPVMPSEPEMTTHEVAGGTAESLPAQSSPLTTGAYDACGETVINIVSGVPRFFAPFCNGASSLNYLPPVLPLSPADVNSDGAPEIYGVGEPGTIAVCGATTQTWAGDSLITRTSVVQTSDGASHRFESVAKVSEETLKVLVPLTLQWATQECGVNRCEIAFGLKWLRISPKGWLDCDNDGDLDMVCTAQGFQVQRNGEDYLSWEGTFWICAQIVTNEGPKVSFWLENTGFQHTNPIAADLNRDGRVDGADLSLVLYAWGQTQ